MQMPQWARRRSSYSCNILFESLQALHTRSLSRETRRLLYPLSLTTRTQKPRISARGQVDAYLVSTQINAHGVITTSTHYDHNLDLQTTSCSLPYCVSMHTTRMLYPCTYIDLLQPRPIRASDIKGSLGCGKSPLRRGARWWHTPTTRHDEPMLCHLPWSFEKPPSCE